MLLLRPHLTAGMAALLTAFLIDQGTKATVIANVSAIGSGIPVFPGLNLVFTRNDGVTFGLLSSVPWWGLSGLALAICIWLATLMLRANSRMEAIAYGLIIGGAFGNVIDRLRFRAVTDFIDIYVRSWHWPAFNLADVFVLCGFGVLLLTSLASTSPAR